jgi:hypothetical protein
MPECHCARLPDGYPGSGVRQLSAIAWSVDTLSCDPRHWVQFLRCRECGQLWEEYHVATGHGENANTRKVHMDAYEALARMSKEGGTTAEVFDFRFDVDDPFTIGVRCLLDHQGISVRVARAPQSATFERARSVIEQKAATNGEVPLRDS